MFLGQSDLNGFDGCHSDKLVLIKVLRDLLKSSCLSENYTLYWFKLENTH